MSERWRPKQIRRDIERRRAGDVAASKVIGRYEPIPDGRGGEIIPLEPVPIVTAVPVMRCNHDKPWRECDLCSKPKRKP